MNCEFRFAIIGCGVISQTHQEQIAAIDGASLVAVSDINEESKKNGGKDRSRLVRRLS
ncbi:hypothetical protein ACFQDF_32620 [Ectobacillus funiculus]